MINGLEKGDFRMNFFKIIFLIMIFLTLVLFGIFIFNFVSNKITGEIIQNSSFFTRAVCNKTNFCQDYEIVCENGRLVSYIPISGSVIQHSLNWIDPRENLTFEKLC